MTKIFSNHLLAGMALLLLSGCAQICTNGSEFEPQMCPTYLPPVSSLHITGNSLSLPGYAEADTRHCKDFRITQAQALAYFATAKRIEPMQSHYTVDISPCYAEGDLQFVNSEKSHWLINELGSASLKTKDEGDVMLFCPDCVLGNIN